MSTTPIQITSSFHIEQQQQTGHTHHHHDEKKNMIELYTYATPAEYSGCLYGSEARRNQQLKRDQAVGFLLCLTMSILLYNKQLRRLYLPLSKIVNAALFLRFLSASLYFYYHSYGENEGNCAEIIVSRIYSGVIMLGELHQVYFVATLLGVGNESLAISFMFSIIFTPASEDYDHCHFRHNLVVDMDPKTSNYQKSLDNCCCLPPNLFYSAIKKERHRNEQSCYIWLE
jgi:hypothetical protein